MAYRREAFRRACRSSPGRPARSGHVPHPTADATLENGNAIGARLALRKGAPPGDSRVILHPHPMRTVTTNSDTASQRPPSAKPLRVPAAVPIIEPAPALYSSDHAEAVMALSRRARGTYNGASCAFRALISAASSTRRQLGAFADNGRNRLRFVRRQPDQLAERNRPRAWRPVRHGGNVRDAPAHPFRC